MRFLPGLELAESYYREAVAPILAAACPELRYAVGLLGSGSDVLGYDTAQSMDHHWGPRLLLFIAEDDQSKTAAIDATLRERLPVEIRGVPTNFGPPDEIGVRLLRPIPSGPVGHMIEIRTIRQFFEGRLGISPFRPLSNRDWLLLPQQRLLEVTAGRVFHDDLGVGEIRARLAWFPEDVWLYLLAAQWKRISQEEAFVGRAGDVDDELGSAVIAARLVHDLMRLVFLMERHYAPYTKWVGTAFSHLAAAPVLEPIFRVILTSRLWQERERHLSEAYSVIASRHNELGITESLPTTVSPYYGRPYQVIHGERFSRAIKGRISDPDLRSLPDIGGIDQMADNTEVLSNPRLFHKFAGLYYRTEMAPHRQEEGIDDAPPAIIPTSGS